MHLIDTTNTEARSRFVPLLGLKRTSLPVALALMVLAACAAPVTHTQPSPQGSGSAAADEHTYPDPRDLAAAHVEAIGGRAAVEAVRGYYATGTEGIVGQGIGATVQEWIRPGEGWRKRWDVDGFGRLEHGYDGRVAWLIRPDRPQDAVRDEKYREAAAFRAVLHPEKDLIGHFDSARTIGRREIAGRSAWEVRITGPAGSVQSRFYDEETGMLRAIERVELWTGDLTRILTVYDDWRPVEGVLFPHRLTRTPTNGPERVTVFESVTTEPAPPEAVRLPAEVVTAASEDRYEVEVERDVMVLMRDGVRLATDIYRPRGAGDRLPVVLIRTPYNKTRAGEAAFVTVLAQRGYVVVVQDSRGKWASEGEFTFTGWRSDRNDGYDAVEWLVSQPWSNGRVGTYGCSRLGITQYMLAAERHPAHVAMIPQAGDGAVGPSREGGAFPLSMAVGWFAQYGAKDRTDAQIPIPLPEALNHLPTVDIMQHYGAGPTDFEEMVSRPLHDPWWQTHGYIAENDRFATPALHVNSWYDRQTFQLVNLMRRNAVDERTREHQYVIISPMTHCGSERATENTLVGELDVGDARLPYWQIYLNWFDHWLKGEKNGVADMARVQYYVTGANEWRSANEWPVPEARPTRLYLRSGGEAGERMHDGVLSDRPPATHEPADRYVYDPGDPVPSRGGTLCCTGNPQDQPGGYDQSDIEQRADVLVYTTPLLDDPLDVVGPMRATLYVSSSAPDTDFTVKLVDVHPDGRAFNVQEGIIRARYRDGLDRTLWMRPGEVYEVEVDLHATAHRFQAGHRVRIEVSSSNFPRFDRNLNTGGDNVTETEWQVAENVVHHSPAHPSYVLLPVLDRAERVRPESEEAAHEDHEK
jgi:uncharacterized protein